MSEAFQIITTAVLILPGVISYFKGRGKADLSDITKLQKELTAQKLVDERLQKQLDEKNKQIEELQKENDVEERILSNRDPNLETTLATIIQGQSAILERLGGAKSE